jgi:hypothetical protein
MKLNHPIGRLGLDLNLPRLVRINNRVQTTPVQSKERNYSLSCQFAGLYLMYKQQILKQPMVEEMKKFHKPATSSLSQFVGSHIASPCAVDTSLVSGYGVG